MGFRITPSSSRSLGRPLSAPSVWHRFDTEHRRSTFASGNHLLSLLGLQPQVHIHVGLHLTGPDRRLLFACFARRRLSHSVAVVPSTHTLPALAHSVVERFRMTLCHPPHRMGSWALPRTRSRTGCSSTGCSPASALSEECAASFGFRNRSNFIDPVISRAQGIRVLAPTTTRIRIQLYEYFLPTSSESR